MSTKLRREETLAAFARLSSLVEPEGYPANTWIREFRYVQRILSDVDIPDHEVLAEVHPIYKRMYSGGRNFDDFFLWREDEMERRLANEELRSAKRDLDSFLKSSN